MDHYQVKFTQKGITHFGVAQYSSEADKAARQGNIIIDDAVYPRAYLVPESEVIDIELSIPKLDSNCNLIPQNEYDQYIVDEYAKHAAVHNAAGKGLQVGKLFTIGVGDGPAYYIVTKINQKTVKVEWRSFQADRWVDHWLGYGGTFPKNKIESLVSREEKLEEIFGR